MEKYNEVEIKVTLIGIDELIEKLENIKKLLDDIKNTKIEVNLS